MLRVSDYNMYFPLNNDANEYIIVHGYSGAFDVVNSEIYRTLESSKNEEVLLANIEKDNLDLLKKRGYVTSKTSEEEIEAVKKIASVLHKLSSKTIEVTIIPTYNCNFRCVYCFEKRLIDKGKDWMNKVMSYETIDAIFNQIKLFKEEGYIVSRIRLFGGEPLLKTNYDLVNYIVEKSKDESLEVDCITNGYDLNEYYTLLGEKGINSVQITLDGEENVHDGRRFLVGGQPSFERIVKNINKCLDTGVHITVRSNVNKKNIQEIENLISMYKENKWTDYKNFSYYFKSTHACYENTEDIVSDIQVMKELSRLYGDIRRFSFNSIYSALAATIFNMLNKKTIAPIKAGYCGATSGMMTIDPFGDIYACWDVFGNKEECIGKVENGSGTFSFNERNDYWRGRTADKIDACIQCKYALFCGGGCAAFAKIANDDYYTGYCSNFKTIFDEVVPDLYNYYASLPTN